MLGLPPLHPVTIMEWLFPEWASQVALLVKNPPASPGDLREAGSIPGSGRCPGGGHSHPLQYSRLENPMDRGASWATVHSVAKSWTQLKRLRDSAPECVSRSPQKMSPGQVLGPNWVVALPFLSLSSFLTPADFTSQHRVDELPAVSHPASPHPTTREAKGASHVQL